MVMPAEVSAFGVTVGETECRLGGEAVDGIVFRLSPRLFVAPGYDDEDAAFAAAELRAAWVHLLSLPRIAVVNRPNMDGWLASSEWSAWRRRLGALGIACAPRRIGEPFSGGWWVRWAGGIGALPEGNVAQRLGSASVEAGPLHTVLCCAGEVVGAPEGDERSGDADLAVALLEAGLVLAEAVVDEQERVVALSTLPPIASEHGDEVADKVTRWLSAAFGR
jgi:hypothetical protein